VQLKKGLYGLIQSARLWYEKLSGDLRDLGFEANKSDECVFNRTEADGSQTTLVLHVDDVLVTAKTTADVKRFLSDIGKKYSDLTIHEGPKLDYLGMHLSWSTRGKCAVTMPGYIDEVLDFASRITGESKTPAGNNLFEIDEASPLLEKGDVEYYHSLTFKLLYLAKRARPDIRLAVSILGCRVQAPTQLDNKKLSRVVQYLRTSAHLGMCLEASKDKPLQAYVWTDASFAVHSDMRSHSGVVLGINKGPAYCKSSVQKLNTTSSTHAEIVGVSDDSCSGPRSFSSTTARGAGECRRRPRAARVVRGRCGGRGHRQLAAGRRAVSSKTISRRRRCSRWASAVVARGTSRCATSSSRTRS
jgi:hypothetical protein